MNKEIEEDENYSEEEEDEEDCELCGSDFDDDDDYYLDMEEGIKICKDCAGNYKDNLRGCDRCGYMEYSPTFYTLARFCQIKEREENDDDDDAHENDDRGDYANQYCEGCCEYLRDQLVWAEKKKTLTFDERGFSPCGLHEDTGTQRDKDGRDRNGVDWKGYGRDGFNSEGVSRKGTIKRGKRGEK